MPLFRTILAVVVLWASACSAPNPNGIQPDRLLTELDQDESIVLFRSAAWLDTQSGAWRLPVHGWVFEPEDSQIRKRAIAAVLEQGYGLKADGDAEGVFSSRVNWLIADNERGKIVFARIGEHDHEMPPTAENGHFRKTITMSASEVDRIAEDGLLRYSVVTNEPTPRTFGGVITLVPPEGISIISDIDDTIKISGVTNRRDLLDYALYREFEPVPGMSQRYSDWARTGVAVHYVSSSPWQLYPTLNEFTVRHGFPGASFHLKELRFRDETLVDLFKDGTRTKPSQIEPILNAWPRRNFVLIGDSGEQDPEIYAELLRRHPDQIRLIYIRNVTDASSLDERFRDVFAGIDPDRWLLFTNPAEIRLQLR